MVAVISGAPFAQLEHEGAALAVVALEVDPGVDQLGQLLAYVEAKPGSLVAPRGRGLDLLEGGEQLLAVLGLDSLAGVHHGEEGHRVAVLLPRELDSNASGIRELDGVVGEVDQD